jgi:hypothetical protein
MRQTFFGQADASAKAVHNEFFWHPLNPPRSRRAAQA